MKQLLVCTHSSFAIHFTILFLLLHSAGEDYIPLENEPLVFDNSVFVICHDMLTMDDSKVEGIETFGLVLKSDDPAAVITNDYIQVSIIEQDRG